MLQCVFCLIKVRKVQTPFNSTHSKDEERKPSVETCITRIKWIGNTVCIPTEGKRYSVFIPNEVRFDFELKEVARGGLLEQVFTSITLPAHQKRLQTFIRAIDALLADEFCKRVFITPASQLTMREIVQLFHEHENWGVSSSGHSNPSNICKHFRAYFRTIEQPLLGGSLVKDVPFRSILKSTPSYVTKKTLISEQPDPESQGDFKVPISRVRHSDATDLNQKALSHLDHRTKKIEIACWNIINSYQRLRSYVTRMKAKDLPAGLTEKSQHNRIDLAEYSYSAIVFRCNTHPLLRNSHEMRGRYIVHWITAKLAKHCDVKLMGKASRLLTKYIPSQDFLVIQTDGDRQTACMADRFLGHTVLVAIQYIFQIHTMWNPDTVRSMTREQLVIGENETVTLYGFKPKTNQHLTPKHFGSGEARIYELAKLLLEHDENVSRSATRRHESIFVGAQGKHRSFGLFNPKIAHSFLIQSNRLAWFAPSQIRDQVANAEYLRAGRDVLVLKELLNHSDLSTIDTYLNHHIQRVLNEANMSEFVRRLDASIRVVLRDNKHSRTEELPLFPPLFSESRCRIDEWIESANEIEIDAAQIAHCMWQRQFYIKNAERLRTENPRQFASIHLPRIVFCTALYIVLSQSKFNYALRKAEQAFGRKVHR